MKMPVGMIWETKLNLKEFQKLFAGGRMVNRILKILNEGVGVYKEMLKEKDIQKKILQNKKLRETGKVSMA